MNVLIVEDSFSWQGILRELVVRTGATASVFAFEDEAITACDRARFDLAIVDLQLASGTGFGVIRHLRRNKSTARIAVLTKHAVPALKIASLEAGANDFLSKSGEYALLLEKILSEAAGG